MPLQQHVLNWLYSVLTSEYHDVDRTYNDVAQVLTTHSTLSPRTDVHTFPNGSSALLLHLTGTIPVNFRGNTYRFPISLWVPHAYPREPPLVYVTPTETMMVRPGQHVDPQGQVYHQYLVGWAQFWDKSNIQDFLSVLADVFAKEPPVVARQAPRQVSRPSQQTTTSPAPPPLPPLPPEMAPRPTQAPQRAVSDSRPPPPPPKEHNSSQSSHPTSPSSAGTATMRSPSISSRYDSAPPLPPQDQSSTPMAGRYGSAQVLPQYQGQMPARPQFDLQAQQYQPPQPHPHPHPHQQPPIYSEPPSGTHHIPQPYSPQQQSQPLPPAHHSQAQWQVQGQPPAWIAGPQGPGQGPATHLQASRQPQPQQPAPPPPNILDEPLTLSIPTNTNIVPPPIPRNPEKDNLLRQLAHTLYFIRQQTLQQNDSSMAGLQAQRSAMQAAMAGIQSESSQLTQLSNLLASNTNILHDALRKADGVIKGSRSHPAPDIDELLVAPTVVSNQLYTLVAEERALGDAIFMLGRAVERGRISPAIFAKMTRSLAREWYLKKALVRKIGYGMGMSL